MASDHILAHMTMAARYDAPAFMQELAAAGNDFDVLSETVARRDGNLPFARLLADLRSDTMAVWAPPGGGAMGALSHVIIHGLDITTAIGLSRTATDEATQIVLALIRTASRTTSALPRLGGCCGRPDWRFGEGEPINASAADLVLALAGRPRPGLDPLTPEN
ncbi:hypothetical protein [Arthrobacter sp. A5]|uniref:hypothetical protein n=1 Tax=Arthrobacter sp. A5 TaxID=576926 RepID=UPI003DA7FC54